MRFFLQDLHVIHFFPKLTWDTKFFSFENEQVLDVPVLDSSSPPGHAAELLQESTKFSNSDSYAIVKEEIQEPSITPKENGVILNTSLMLQEKKANYSATVKVWEALSIAASTFLHK